MKKYIAVGQKIENLVVIMSFIVMTLASFAQVVNRNFIGYSVSWFEELARYCMVYMALLGTEAGFRDGSQIAITAITDKFKGIPRSVLAIVVKIIIVAFSAVVFYTSFTLLEKQISYGQFSPGLGLPMYVPYAALPFSFGIITLVQFFTLVAMIIDLFSPKKVSEGGAA